jgi:hypothetical protein
MNDELAEYISTEERAVLPSLMDETENWLYSGDESVYDKKALENKCAIFIEISDTIYGRFNNWKNIFQTINLVDECNASNMNKLNQIYDTSLKNYLNEEDIFNLIANSNKSLNELKTGLLKSPKFMDPPVLADKIKADYNELNNVNDKYFH